MVEKDALIIAALAYIWGCSIILGFPKVWIAPLIDYHLQACSQCAVLQTPKDLDSDTLQAAPP